jgi:hypothetical protein
MPAYGLTAAGHQLGITGRTSAGAVVRVSAHFGLQYVGYLPLDRESC